MNFSWHLFISWLHSFILIQWGMDRGFECNDYLNIPFDDSWQPLGWKQLTWSLSGAQCLLAAPSVCSRVLVLEQQAPQILISSKGMKSLLLSECVCLSLSCHRLQRQWWQVGLMQLLPRLRGCQTSIMGGWGIALKSHSELLTNRELAQIEVGSLVFEELRKGP